MVTVELGTDKLGINESGLNDELHTTCFSRWYSSITYWYFGEVIPKKSANFSPQYSAAKMKDN